MEAFLKDNEESLTDEERQKFLDAFLDGRHIDFSGVTAIRGFLYQYYVAAKYIIDMLFTHDVWWNKVVYELLDDIALHGEGKIRFVQVKTKRESDLVNNLTLGEICERTNSKGSWLDKLFLLNTHVFDSDEKKIIKNDDLFNNELQFELATNVQFNKDIAVYTKDEKFYTDRDDSEYESLIKNLRKLNLNWKIKEKGHEFIFNVNNYDDSINNPIWYLQRFRIKRYGNIVALRAAIVDKIKTHTSGNLDEFHGYKAGIVLDCLIQEIIRKTCQDDDGISQENFIFRKEDLQRQFEEWCEFASNQANKASENDSLRERFMQCFVGLRNEIEAANWKPNLRDELVDGLTSMQDYLDQQFLTKEDSSSYQRFLQRLFYRNNSQGRFPFDDVKDTNYLYNSLKNLVYLFVLYKQVAYSPKEARLLFQKGLEDGGIWNVFSLYNTRGKEDIELAKKSVRISAAKCAVSQDFNHDYNCLVADYKKVRKRRAKVRGQSQKDSVYASVAEPVLEKIDPLEYIDSEMKITKKTENIKFSSIDFIEEFFAGLKEEEPEFSFSEEEVIEEWKDLLLEQFEVQGDE